MDSNDERFTRQRLQCHIGFWNLNILKKLQPTGLMKYEKFVPMISAQIPKHL